MCRKLFSHKSESVSLSVICDFGTPWTVAHQAPLSMGFSRQDYLNGLLCPSPGNLADPRNEFISFISLALAGIFFTTSATWKAQGRKYCEAKETSLLRKSLSLLKSPLLQIEVK